MKNLRLTLLSSIISAQGVYHGKYSGGYNAIKSIIELEELENNNKIPQSFFDKFKEIQILSANLNEKLHGVPLIVIEQYFLRNSQNLNKYVYIDYNHLNIEFIVIDLYVILERFFNEIYALAVRIADYYNLEVKLKKIKTSDENLEFV